MAYIFTKLAQVDSISDIDNLNLNIIVENDGEINRVATDLIQPDFSKLKDDLIFNDINLYLQNNEDDSKGNLTIYGNLSGLKDANISGSLTSDQLIVQTEATVHNIHINGNCEIQNGCDITNGINLYNGHTPENAIIKFEEDLSLKFGLNDSGPDYSDIILSGIHDPINDSDAVNKHYLNQSINNIKPYGIYIDITNDMRDSGYSEDDYINYIISQHLADGFYYIKEEYNNTTTHYYIHKTTSQLNHYMLESNIINTDGCDKYIYDISELSIELISHIQYNNDSLSSYITLSGNRVLKFGNELSYGDDENQVILESRTYRQPSSTPIETINDDDHYPTTKAVKDYVDSHSSGSDTIKKLVKSIILYRDSWIIDSSRNVYTQDVTISELDDSYSNATVQVSPDPNFINDWNSNFIRCTDVDVSTKQVQFVSNFNLDKNVTITLLFWR